MLRFYDHTEPERDVLITGIGMVTPLGIGRECAWNNLLQGQRAARPLTCCELDHFDPLQELLRRTPGGAPVDHAEVRRRVETAAACRGLPAECRQDPLIAMTMLALLEAAEDAQLPLPLQRPNRTGCVIGTSKSSLRAMEWQTAAMRPPVHDDRRPNVHWTRVFPADAPLIAARQVSAAAGPGSCPVAACATGLISAIQGAALIHADLCDVCLVGSGDASLRSSVMAAYHRLGILSRRQDAATACRPVDADRDGCVLGEGAAVLVLESRQHAEARAATAYGRMLTGGWLSDATGLTQIDTDGTVVAELLRRLTGQTFHADGAEPVSLDHINLHATGTESNDLAEARGVAAALSDPLPVCSAIKGSMGHLLGAAGSTELGFTLLSLRDQVVPPAVNLFSPDPECRISLAASEPRPVRQRHVAKLSLGFGGHVAGCIMAAEPDGRC